MFSSFTIKKQRAFVKRFLFATLVGSPGGQEICCIVAADIFILRNNLVVLDQEVKR
jgi:hypothetical protein